MKNASEQQGDRKAEKPASNSNNLLSGVSFIAKPSPPQTLNDLEEAGRIRLTVHFEQHRQNNTEMPVKHVSAKITNNAKTRSSTMLPPRMTTSNDNLDTGDNLKEDVIFATAELAQKGLDTWYGEIAIPCNWFEGGSKTFERTGSFSPHYDDSLFTMIISWKLFDDSHAPESSRKSVVELHSTDAFHWEQK